MWAAPGRSSAARFLPYGLRRIWHPSIFQGKGKRKRYFEGWYNKVVSPGGDVYAFIPGVYYDETRKGGAFIQFIDGKSTETGYLRFPLGKFSFSKHTYQLEIGSSSFGDQGMSLDLVYERHTVSGSLRYSGMVGLESSVLSPGIMGWYTFAPFMECYHGVVSLDHQLEGTIRIDGREIDFTGGRGYIEKDWGRSFPSSWVWLQSNHFARHDTSFMCSIARIPWLGGSFPGFLCVLLFEGRQYRFATYTGAELVELTVSDGTVRAAIHDASYRLSIEAQAGAPGGLKAPVNGTMSRIITESVTSRITLRLSDLLGNILFEDSGRFGGMEIAGEISELIN
jgi:hypothetical protein